MTDKTDTTVRKEWDIGKVLGAHRRIVRAAHAYLTGKITWNNYADIADQYGRAYTYPPGTLSRMR